MSSKKSYSDKLRDPRWQKKRLEIMERDEFFCHGCCDDSIELNVHHLYYLKNRDPWDYPNDAFITLCEDCHKEMHLTKEAFKPVIAKIESFDVSDHVFRLFQLILANNDPIEILDLLKTHEYFETANKAYDEFIDELRGENE